MKDKQLILALRIVILYAIAGGLWILLSDKLAGFLFTDPAQLTIVQTYKGWFFILVTSLLLFLYISRESIMAREAEHNFQNTLDNANEGIFQSTPQGKYLHVNPTMARIYGYDSSKEMISAINDIGTQSYASEETRKEFSKTLIRKGSIEGFEAQNYRKDGTIIWTSTNARVVRNPNGTPLYFEGFVTDVTNRKQAETDLKEAETLYRDLVEQIPAAVYTYKSLKTEDSGIYISPQIEAMSGYSLQEWTSQRGFWQKVIHPDDLEKFTLANDRSDSTGMPFDIEYRIQTRDGGITWIHDRSRLVRDDNGKPLYWQGIMLDITVQKLTEQRIREKEEQYRTLIEQASDGIIITDIEGTLQEVNSSICGMLGYGREEFLRLNMRNLFGGNEIQNLSLHSRDAKEGKTVITERKLRKKDGTLLSAEISSKMLPDGRMLGMIRDITERLKAEQIRLDEQERFRLLIENSMDAIGLYSEEGMILYESPAVKSILGYNSEELEGRNILDIIYIDDLEQFRRDQQKLLQSSDQPIVSQVRMRHKDGSYRWIEIISTNRLKEPGVRAIVGNYRDVSERKTTEKALLESGDQYRRLVEHSPYAIIVHQHGQLVYVNQAGVKLFGAGKSEELYGTSFINFLHRDSLSTAVKRLQELQQGVEAPPVQEKLVRFDGSTVHVEERAYPFTYQGLPAVQVVIRDMTEQKQAEEAIRTSEERFSKAFHSSPIATQITTLSEGRFVDVNDAYLKLSGWSREELIGHTEMELHFFETPEGRVKFLERLRNPKPRQGWEDKFITIDGEILDTLAFYELIELGGETCILSMLYDMTGQKRAQEAIRISEERLRAILDHTQNIFYSRTPDHLLTYMSEQTRNILGYQPGEILKDWHELLTDHPINQRGIELAQKAIDTGKSQEPYVLELKTKSGRHVWVEARESPVVRDGKTVAVVGALTDISERQEAQAQQERQLTELTVLAAIATEASQSTSEDEVIEKTTQIAAGVLYPDDCGVLLLDENKNTLKVHYSYRRGNPKIPPQERSLSEGITGMVVSMGKPVRVNDVTKDPTYIEVTAGIRSELCVPIRVNEKVIGVFNAESKKAGAFHENDERVLNTIAGTLGTAIERIRLFEAEKQRGEESENLRQAAVAVSSSLEASQVLYSILNSLLQVVHYDSASIYLLQGEQTTIVAARGFPDSTSELNKPIHRESVLFDTIRATSRPIIISDVLKDDRFIEWNDKPTIRSWMGVPLIARGEVIGFLTLDSRQINSYGENQAKLAETFALQASTSISNARLYEAEQKRRQEAEKLRQAATTVASSLKLQEVLDILLITLKEVVPYDNASILLPDGENVRIVASQGLVHHEQPLDRLLPANNRLLQQIHTSGQPLILEDAQKDSRFENWSGGNNVHGWMGIPMITRGHVIGYITLDNLEPAAYGENTASLAQAFAHQAAAAIENARLFENLQEAYDTTLEGWGNALELRDKETQGHTRRVTQMTLDLARLLGCSDEQLVNIRRGVLVHDIGKMGISDRILHKKGPLTKKEAAEMRKHPQYAHDLLYPIPYLRPALEVAYYHHERWDGTGYPRGLKGEEIPMAARIFAIVDVWDALLSNRPYRKSWSKKKVMKYIRGQSGTHFDPSIVEVFLKMVNGKAKK